MKIAVYTMARNEAEHVDRYAETTQGADIVVVTDTGSTDGTPDLLRQHGIEVREARVVPWRFDIATNVALCNVPEDIDLCVKLDLDEVLWTPSGESWRPALEELWTTSRYPRRVRYWYTWSWLVPGKIPGSRFRAGHIHARSGFLWMHPGHAALTDTLGGDTLDTDAVEIHHYMTDKSRPDYQLLLERAVEENRCPRTLFYLGREYFFHQQDPDAIAVLQEYLEHPRATWKAERANAMRMLGICYARQNVPEAALRWLIQATEERPGVRELWWELLKYFHDRQDWLGGLWAGRRCLELRERDAEWISGDTAPWTERPFLYTAACAIADNRFDLAIQCLREAREWPGARLEAVMQFAEEHQIAV